MGILKNYCGEEDFELLYKPLTEICKHVSFIEKENDAGVQENLTVGDHIKQLEGCSLSVKK